MPPDFDVLPEIDVVDIPTDEERLEIPPELKHTVLFVFSFLQLKYKRCFIGCAFRKKIGSRKIVFRI